MKPPAVPPCPDRLSHNRNIIIAVGIAILAAVVLGLIFLMSESSSNLEKLDKMNTHTPQADRRKEQNEFAQAFAATQNAVLRKMNPAEIQQVRWRNTRHEGHNGYYQIEGTVDFSYGEKETYSMFYQATTFLKNNEWQVTIHQYEPVSSS